jgi:phenylacetate-CoA ligase
MLLRDLERTQWLNREALAELQAKRLRALLQHAATHVPYYRDLIRASGLAAGKQPALDSLEQLPFLTKSIIREQQDRLKSEVAERLVKYNTGGSSGEPLVFWMGMDRVSHDVAAKWRATRWWGVDIGDPEIVLWGSPIELGAQDLLKGLRDRLLRTRLLPAFQMDEASMGRYLETIRSMKARMLFGYASAVAMLARHAESQGISRPSPALKVVFTTGETLYPEQREVIERVFGAPVANGYGSRDAGFIAHQCPQGSLHVSAEHLVVELVDDKGAPVAPGETGEVVVTHLATRDFPFIRYRTGDVAVMQKRPCACGRGLPVLESVLGRSTDFIVTPSGNAMHALALIYEIRDKPGVRAFKIVQAEDFSVKVLVVPGPGPGVTDAVRDSVLSGLRRRLGPGVAVDLECVEAIAPERSGKYRYVVSRAAPRGTH